MEKIINNLQKKKSLTINKLIGNYSKIEFSLSRLILILVRTEIKIKMIINHLILKIANNNNFKLILNQFP